VGSQLVLLARLSSAHWEDSINLESTALDDMLIVSAVFKSGQELPGREAAQAATRHIASLLVSRLPVWVTHADRGQEYPGVDQIHIDLPLL